MSTNRTVSRDQPRGVELRGGLIFAAGLFWAVVIGGEHQAFAQAPPVSLGITTAAGRARIAGYVDGPGALARFNLPEGLAVDASGNAYAADGINNAIRKISPDGTTITLAGGTQGTADGAGTNAGFNFPSSVALDAAGDLYVADQFNHAIRKVTAAGVVTTIAGYPGRNAGDQDGTGTNAYFNHPSAVVVGDDGTLYVADTWNQAIRKITTNGVVTTLATNIPLNYPAGLALGASNSIYVADTGNSCIRMITTNGATTTLAGSAGLAGNADGSGTNAQFAFPGGIALDAAGNVWVSDSGNNTIREISPGGIVTTVYGQAGRSGGTGADGTNALFYQPWGLAFDGAGNLYVAESLNNTIRIIATNGLAGILAGPGGSSGSDSGAGAAARFNFPSALAVDGSGDIYVADLLNFVIRKITPGGTAGILAGQTGEAGDADGPGTNALFASPTGLALDSLGNVYVADADNQTIRVISPGGTVSTLAGQSGAQGSADGTGTNATFNNPTGVAAGPAGNVYVADNGNQTIRQITPGGAVSTIAGQTGVTGSADGTGTNATFNNPSALAVDGAGNIYVADTGNEVVRKITTNGAVSTLAGLAGNGGSADGAGTNASFSAMSGIAVDAAGNVYVADTGSETIRLITPNGVVTTIGGTPDQAGSMDGTGASALFSLPMGVAAGPAGAVYVADALNNSIRAGVVFPTLQIAEVSGGVVLSWSGMAPGFNLETSPALVAPVVWTALTNGVSMAAGEFVLTNQPNGSPQFYRLRGP